MGRVPHLYLPPPWDGPELPLPPGTAHHLARVLRRGHGAPVSYTDGAGSVGEGRLADAHVVRGAERQEQPAEPAVTVAVAPPRRLERTRFVVEKLAELGVDRLVWLATTRGEAGPPRAEKSAAWAVSALEQSRGAHLMTIEGPLTVAELRRPLWVADPGGALPAAAGGSLTVAIGPEGGFAGPEIPADATLVGLGSRMLRTETASVAAAVLALQATGRLPAPEIQQSPAYHDYDVVTERIDVRAKGEVGTGDGTGGAGPALGSEYES